MMKVARHKHNMTILTILLFVLVRPNPANTGREQPALGQDSPPRYFKIQIVDRQTGRGVPLVELRTTNNIRYFTDSHGIAAFYEPGLMDRDVFFFVESHGYEFPKDGFGMRGKILRTTPAAKAVIEIDRINVAERLYRVTGQGIYRDSMLTGQPVPLENPVLNGQVIGQDSVFTSLYEGRLFWMWGDTARPSYPLGNFAMSGALSDLPDKGGLDPEVGVDLYYFVDEKGFSRPMAPFKEPGLIWLDGLMTVPNNDGRTRMLARFTRLKDMTEVLERGLVIFNDATGSFEPLVRSCVEFLPYSNTGRAFSVSVNGLEYYYFTIPSPSAVRMRVRAKWDAVTEPNRYEVLTALESRKSTGRAVPRMDLGESPAPYRWVPFGELIGDDLAAKSKVIKALEQEAKDVTVHDIETDKEILAHGGTVYFNPYRKRWIEIFVQQGGGNSYLGEVWYAEADSPVGPWGYARKIVRHNKYSFYHPYQHLFFDQNGGRTVYFEGTYSYMFSGPPETATPRYDYNQIMYRLNLDDPRLALPVAVYQLRDKNEGIDYLLRDAVETNGGWDAVESIPFYAIEPGRARDGLTAVYVERDRRGTLRLTTDQPTLSARPLFYALAHDDATNKKPYIVPLYEYSHADSGACFYSTDLEPKREGWTRGSHPICQVWKAPQGPLLLDSSAERPKTPEAEFKLELIRPSNDGTHFVCTESGHRFTAWGFNYDHDESGRLLEDYWRGEWSTVVEDFREMKTLGANVIRIHLQVAKFMKAPAETNEAALERLGQLVKLAEETGLYLDITGLGCYHKKDVPAWYHAMSEAQRWDTQAVFWKAVAKTCAISPAVFCYDLMNEPILPGSNKTEIEWLAGEFVGKHFVQRIALDLAGRTRKQVAKAWVNKLAAAIRKHDGHRMITVGVIPWVHTFPKAKPLFYSEQVSGNLDFASVHFYPKSGQVDKALTALEAYDVGKPLVVEEMFPLSCSMEEMGTFIDASRTIADGWIGFYWGKTPEDYANEDVDLAGALTKSWLEYFRAKAPEIPGGR